MLTCKTSVQSSTHALEREPALNVRPKIPSRLHTEVYDANGNLYKTSFAKQRQYETSLRTNSSLSLTNEGLEGRYGFEPGFAASLTIGRSKESLRKSIDPSGFQGSGFMGQDFPRT